MRVTIRSMGWVAAAVLATQFTGGAIHAQTFDGGPYQVRGQRSVPAPSYSEYKATSNWATFASANHGGGGAPLEHAAPQPPIYDDPASYGLGGKQGLSSCGGSNCGSLSGNVYGDCLLPYEGRCGWFGGVGGLAMARERDNFFAFSYDTNDESDQLVNNRDVEFDCAGGVEARFGRYFHCGTSSLEFVFWTVIPGSQSYTLLGSDVVGDLNGIHNWDQLTYNGNTADNYVNDAMAHRIRREYEFQNYEMNWNTHIVPPTNGAWELQTIAGFRIFRFGETLDFTSDTVDTQFTGAADELQYLVDVDNRLYGFQLGGRSEYRLTERFSLTAKVLGGIYANDVDHRSRIGGSAGDAFVNNGPNNGDVFDIRSSKTDFAMMGELELGGVFQLTRNWEIGGGYRAMGISGVALTTNQIYPDLRGTNDVEVVDTNGDLILHGGYINLMYNY